MECCVSNIYYGEAVSGIVGILPVNTDYMFVTYFSLSLFFLGRWLCSVLLLLPRSV